VNFTCRTAFRYDCTTPDHVREAELSGRFASVVEFKCLKLRNCVNSTVFGNRTSFKIRHTDVLCTYKLKVGSIVP
jgi:hypothetical protein